jgi:hypothetical protein
MARYPTAPVDPTPPQARGRDRLALPVTIALALAFSGLMAWSVGAFADEIYPGQVVSRQDPLLPDLAMGPIEDIAIGTTDVGSFEHLRFGATIVNIGEGAFVLRASRRWIGSEEWAVEQWIPEAAGGYSVQLTRSSLIFGGDGHGHWHVRQVEAHQLETLDGEILGRLVKQGFCFFDTDLYEDLPGAPENRHWGARGCASSFDTRVRMGLSIGWGDKYPWYLLDERIDVTGLPDGQYRIREIADPNDEFEESDETNNETWVVIEIGTTPDGLRSSRVVEEGPLP